MDLVAVKDYFAARLWRLATIALVGLMSTMFAVAPLPARAQLSISLNFGPPAIPVYQQPPCPTPNYIWSPGYWAAADGGYYWVPGTWVPAPAPGLVWTPGYWGYDDGSYGWNQGYWAPQVGYYGGINYGNGYYGRGYNGGGWQGNQYRYNTAVTNVNQTVIRNVYVNKTVVINNYNRQSYNGGPNGVAARPTPAELAGARGRRVAVTNAQLQHQRIAAANRANFAKVNHGRPAVAAVPRPYDPAHRPVGARGVSAAQHITATHPVVKHPAAVHAAVVHHAAVHRAAVVHEPVHHAAVVRAPVHHAAVVRAPVHHPAAVREPVHHPVAHAAVSHPAAVRAVHAAHAPAPRRPAPERAPKPAGHEEYHEPH